MLRRSPQTFTRLLDASDSATESRLAHNRPFGAATSRLCAMSVFQSLSYPARPAAGTKSNLFRVFRGYRPSRVSEEVTTKHPARPAAATKYELNAAFINATADEREEH
jgi:hypothetical protein